MADSGGKEFGLPEGIPPGKRVIVETKGHRSNEEALKKVNSKLRQSNRRLRKGIPALTAVTLVAGVTAGIVAQPDHEKNVHKSKDSVAQVQLSGIKTSPYHEIESLNKLKKQTESQLEVGKQVTIEDLYIAVPEGVSLKIRYYAGTLPVEEGEPDDIAVEIPAGNILQVKDAALVKGELADPNDPLSNLWDVVNLEQFGLEGFGYISRSAYTRSSVIPSDLETATISNRGENGALFFERNGKQHEIGKVTAAP